MNKQRDGAHTDDAVRALVSDSLNVTMWGNGTIMYFGVRVPLVRQKCVICKRGILIARHWKKFSVCVKAFVFLFYFVFAPESFLCVFLFLFFIFVFVFFNRKIVQSKFCTC